MPEVIDLKLKKGEDAALKKGFPWVYKGQFNDTSELHFALSGAPVNVYAHNGSFIGTGYFNNKTTIAARILRTEKKPIDEEFFLNKFKAAIARREKKIKVPFYRLVHSEADGLAGLIIDRFGETIVCQVATAGMENLKPLWLPMLEKLIQPKTIIFRNDFSARKTEGLKEEKNIFKGNLKEISEVQENGIIYLADLMNGQKTGWFYDQRENRKMIADLCKGKSMAYIYSHSGGFGLVALAKGAASVTMVDSSEKALNLAKQAAKTNQMDVGKIKQIHESAFVAMEKLAKENVKFDVVVSDPPAFVKTKKDIESGIKGYEKVAKLSSPLVAEGGYLFVASCSHHASRSRFNKAVLAGVKAAKRTAEVVKQTGADIDHPLHGLLPQSEYLKGILLKLD